ncbi:MAG TPA: hypothetical protein VKG61_07575 [Streptosporangiaceae bacterium]|nr:hypothetical protein [Streptosporangiaceae bacterium]
MNVRPGRPRGITRLTRALGLDRNPLRRASDRAEAWIRVGLLAVFLIAGPMAAGAAGAWAYHAGITGARVQAAQTSHDVPAVALQPVFAGGLAKAAAGSHASLRARSKDTAASARTGEVLAEVMTLALIALVLLAVLRLTTAFLTRRRLAAWETAWSRVGPQWSRGRP